MFKYDTALHTLEKRCLYLIVVHWNRNSKVVGKDGRRVLKEKCMFKIHFINSISFLKRGIFSPLKKKKKALNGPFVPLQSVLCGKVRSAWEVVEKAGTHDTHGDNTQTHTLSHTL